jgi:hypothetical protein
LELFHRSTLSFQQIAGEATSHPVAVFQRIDQAGYKRPIDERILADTDTLLVFGLDHLLSEQGGHTWRSRSDSRVAQTWGHQPIDPDRPHPFTAAGNTEFNCLLWMPPNQQRAGDIVLVDSTNFTTLFGGTDSLQNYFADEMKGGNCGSMERFWKNLGTAKHN